MNVFREHCTKYQLHKVNRKDDTTSQCCQQQPTFQQLTHLQNNLSSPSIHPPSEPNMQADDLVLLFLTLKALQNVPFMSIIT